MTAIAFTINTFIESHRAPFRCLLALGFPSAIGIVRRPHLDGRFAFLSICKEFPNFFGICPSEQRAVDRLRFKIAPRSIAAAIVARRPFPSFVPWYYIIVVHATVSNTGIPFIAFGGCYCPTCVFLHLIAPVVVLVVKILRSFAHKNTSLCG